MLFELSLHDRFNLDLPSVLQVIILPEQLLPLLLTSLSVLLQHLLMLIFDLLNSLKLLRPLNHQRYLFHGPILFFLELLEPVLHELHLEVDLLLLECHPKHLHSLVPLPLYLVNLILMLGSLIY
jgi:hypothetical protein